MNDMIQRQALRDAVKKRFRKSSALKSKVKLHYKENLEREYKRVIDAYYAILLEALQSTLEILFAAPMPVQDAHSEYRLDDYKSDFIDLIRQAFKRAGKTFHDKEQLFGLQEKIDKMAQLTKKLSVSEWKRTVSKTLGINILDDYYDGEFYREQLKRWVDENVNLISTLPDESLDEMQSIVEEGFLEGKSNRDIVKDIQERYGASRNKARFWAVDQLAKLNASIAQQQQTECGVEEYEWSSSRDARVRDRHRELDGTVQRWDTPPIVDEKTGRRAHPGEDYRCRCVAIPIFKFETLDIPVDIKINQGGT